MGEHVAMFDGVWALVVDAYVLWGYKVSTLGILVNTYTEYTYIIYIYIIIFNTQHYISYMHNM
jgi:hypothetical protein